MHQPRACRLTFHKLLSRCPDCGWDRWINPCAFTVLLLFITAMLATLQAGTQSINTIRARLLSRGGIYIAAIFLTYLSLGVGLLKTMDFFTRQHAPARFGALLAILFGLWMLKDFFLPDWGWRLQSPGRIGVIARQSAKKPPSRL